MPKFSQALFDKICDRIANGESLRSICQGKDMPSKTAVFKWLKADGNGSLVDQYVRAREGQADAIFDECLNLADEVNGPEDVPKARLQIDTRKWMAGKLRPKVYGDKIAIGGAEDLPPVRTVSATMTPQEAAEAYVATLNSKEG
ncbi:terminase small subunit-like protein [Halovulum sp. GXIMD14793]